MASKPLCSAFLQVACLLCLLQAAWCKEDVAACDEESILQLITQKNDLKAQSPMSTNNNTATAMVQTDAHLKYLTSEGAAFVAWKDAERQWLSKQKSKASNNNKQHQQQRQQQQQDVQPPQSSCDYPPDVTVLWYPPEKSVPWWPTSLLSQFQTAVITDCEVKCIKPASSEHCQNRADGVVYHLPNQRLHNFQLPHKQFNIGISMESTANYPFQEPSALRAAGYDVVATTRPDSDVPVAYFTASAFTQLQLNSFPGWDDRMPAAAFVATNCGWSNFAAHRITLVSQLSKLGVPVDSLGSCAPPGTRALHNSTYRRGNKVEFLKAYRVYLAFENSAEPGYVSEKVMDGYASGAVAVYWGAPDIYNYVPPASLIRLPDNTDDKDALQVVARQIMAVISNKSQWDQMMQCRSQNASSWKTEGGMDLLKLWDSPKLKGSISCRMCRLAYNHKKQANMSLSISAVAKPNEPSSSYKIER
ncbi:unnamed protein product [Polarella glacialis]|uniref:Fucosyltransferase n=1 Tax=Polarella glacialis TaxID=89957 RepID=A0A813DDJ2_POLGL|nr:unnamed protein product [Polarella glacialis]